MITVIIPTYKRAKYIDRAIKSVLDQSYQGFEIIVVDDNSEGTIERHQLEQKMKKYANNPKVKYIKHKKNLNGAAARNTGIKEAKGEYITFLDDDDYYLPNRFEVLIKKLEENKEYNAIYSSLIITKNKKFIGDIVANKSGNLQKELLLNQVAFGAGTNMIFKASSLKEISGFDESFVRHQDIELMVRYFEKNKVLACNEYLAVLAQDDRGNEVDPDKYLEVKKHYFKKFNETIKKLTKEDQDKFFASNYMSVLISAIKKKKNISFYKENVLKYSKNNFKLNFKIFVYRLNNLINLDNIKYFFKNKKLKKILSEETKKYVKEMECFF